MRAIYSSFPATLFYYSPRQHSGLYDHKDIGNRPDSPIQEAVVVESDGLVYPASKKNTNSCQCNFSAPRWAVEGLTELAVSNGAVMFPNTFAMQEFTRQYYDDHMNLIDEGKEAEAPFIYAIPKCLRRVLTWNSSKLMYFMQVPRSQVIWFSFMSLCQGFLSGHPVARHLKVKELQSMQLEN